MEFSETFCTWNEMKNSRRGTKISHWLIRFCISLIKAADLVSKRLAQIITTISKIDLSKLFMMEVNVDQMQNYAPDLFTILENLEILKIELKCDWLKCLRHLSISNWTDVSYNWTIGSIFKFRNKEIKSHRITEMQYQQQMNEGACFQCAMLMAIKQNSGFCWISHRFDNNSYLARLREQIRFTRWRRRLADAMKHDEEEELVILANSGMGRRNYTKTDIRTQIYGITQPPSPDPRADPRLNCASYLFSL